MLDTPLLFQGEVASAPSGRFEAADDGVWTEVEGASELRELEFGFRTERAAAEGTRGSPRSGEVQCSD